jgi:hypothetical protein
MRLFAVVAAGIAPDPLFATTIEDAGTIGYRVGIH